MSKNTDEAEIKEIDCLEAVDSLYAYLDDELDDEQSLARFNKHLSHCRSCYTRSEIGKNRGNALFQHDSTVLESQSKDWIT